MLIHPYGDNDLGQINSLPLHITPHVLLSYTKICKGGSPGLGVKGGDSYSKGIEFESQGL